MKPFCMILEQNLIFAKCVHSVLNWVILVLTNFSRHTTIAHILLKTVMETVQHWEKPQRAWDSVSQMHKQFALEQCSNITLELQVESKCIIY